MTLIFPVVNRFPIALSPFTAINSSRFTFSGSFVFPFTFLKDEFDHRFPVGGSNL